MTSRTLVNASGVFRTTPWAYPMIFLVIGIIPTIRMVVDTIHTPEHHSPQRHT